MHEDAQQVLGFWDTLRILRRRWIVIASCVLLFIAAAVAIALSSQRIYRAEAIILPVAADASQSGLAAIVGQLGSLGGLVGGAARDSSAQNLALLESPQFLMGFIMKHKILSELLFERWDSATNTWRAGGKRLPTLQDGYLRLANQVLSVRKSRDTGVVTLSVDWHDPKRAAQWANALIAELNQNARTQAIQEAQASIAYLNQQLAKTSILEMQQSMYRLLETQLNSEMIANGRREYAFRVLSAAYAPDPNRYVRPRPVLMVALGLIGGLMFGACLALFLERAPRGGSK